MDLESVERKLPRIIEEGNWKEVRKMLQEAKSNNTLQKILSEDKLVLLTAVSNNAPMDLVTSLISPSNINMQHLAEDTVLHEAVCEKRWELVPVLLQHGADVNVGNIWNQTPLYNAVYHDAPTDTITQLISIHNINMQGDDGSTAIHWVVRKKRWELVPVLLQHGADVNMCDRKTYTPLHWAVLFGAPADVITQMISPHNIKIQSKDGDTLLHKAVKKKRWELVPVLLQHGADVNRCNGYQETPLYWAAHLGASADIITQMISPQNINKQDEDGYTALHKALRKKRWELVPVLMQHGADVNLDDDCFESPLHVAVHYGAPADIISRLISPHNINMQDKNGDTVLYWALRGERWDLVPVLLQHEANPFICDILPEPPLPLSLQSLCIVTIRSHMPAKCDEMFERLGLPQTLLPELKLKPLADEIIALKQRMDIK